MKILGASTSLSSFDTSLKTFHAGYLETELNATDEYFLLCSIIHKIYVMTHRSITHPQMYLWRKFEDPTCIPCDYLETLS